MKDKIAFWYQHFHPYCFFDSRGAANDQSYAQDRVHIIYRVSWKSLTPVRRIPVGVAGSRLHGRQKHLDRTPLCGRQIGSNARLVNELVQERVDVIVATNNVVIRAAKEATKTIPIVMISSVDPVAAGYVESFAHPGGNITGLAWLGRDLSAKRVELLKEVASQDVTGRRILWDADGPGPAVAFKEYEAAARAFKLELRSLEVRGPNPDFVGSIPSCENSASWKH